MKYHEKTHTLRELAALIFMPFFLLGVLFFCKIEDLSDSPEVDYCD